jgi:hypothetical protein
MGHHPTAAPHELIDGLLTIRLGAAAATVDTSTGSRVMSRSYPLDALETVQTRARLVNGVLTVHRTEVVQLPAGQATVETIERFSIQADGTLLLERTATTQGRSTTRRQIFERRQ